jgi:predicted transcriptional regulator
MSEEQNMRSPKRHYKDAATVGFSLRLPPDLMQFIGDRADREKRTRHAVVLDAIALYAALPPNEVRRLAAVRAFESLMAQMSESSPDIKSAALPEARP